MTNRRLPTAVPAWCGCATMLALRNAAPSIAYSLVNIAPSNNIRASERITGGIEAIGDFTGMLAKCAQGTISSVMTLHRSAASRRGLRTVSAARTEVIAAQ